jgi:hypothetical protein
LRGEGKIKALYELCRYFQRIPGLAALTSVQKVIQTSECKIKGTHSLFLQSIGRTGLGATCGVCDRVGFHSVVFDAFAGSFQPSPVSSSSARTSFSVADQRRLAVYPAHGWRQLAAIVMAVNPVV